MFSKLDVFQIFRGPGRIAGHNATGQKISIIHTDRIWMPNATSHIWLKRTERLCADIASPANHDAEKPNHERNWPVGFESLAQCEKMQTRIRQGECGLRTLPEK